MNRAEVMMSRRHAGGVKRYHTWPTLRTQTVADHSWHVMRIFLELFPDAVTMEVLTWILWHDVAEVGTGDIPFPLKSRYPELKSIMDDIGTEVTDNMGIVWPELTDRQRALIKICDLLEMYQWGIDEVMMGNQYARPIVEDTLAAAQTLAATEEVLDEFWAYTNHGRKPYDD